MLSIIFGKSQNEKLVGVYIFIPDDIMFSVRDAQVGFFNIHLHFEI